MLRGIDNTVLTVTGQFNGKRRNC